MVPVSKTNILIALLLLGIVVVWRNGTDRIVPVSIPIVAALFVIIVFDVFGFDD